MKSEIKSVSKYGKVMLTWAVISTEQLISSFLVMLHLTVFCLNQLWRTARTWKLLRWDGHSLSLLCLPHFVCALVPLCPHFSSLLPDFCFSCFFACTSRNTGGIERSEWLPLRELPLWCFFLNSVSFTEFLFDGRSWLAGWLKKPKFAMHRR